ncbi:MAG: RHS repeat protein [Methylococcales bacterium]|nr:RHS repeat protein [Methylococcales bacterium]
MNIKKYLSLLLLTSFSVYADTCEIGSGSAFRWYDGTNSTGVNFDLATNCIGIFTENIGWDERECRSGIDGTPMQYARSNQTGIVYGSYDTAIFGICRNPPVGEQEEDLPKSLKNKSFGQLCDDESTFGNPCNASNGNKYQKETDYTGNNTQLSFIRHYNSGLGAVDNGIGYGWVHQWAAKLDISSNKITIQQSDGRGESFVLQNNLWQGDADTQLALVQDSTGYTLSNKIGTVERYDLNGNLLTKTDLTGKQTQYSYNAEQQLITLTSPFGHSLQFNYNADKRIESVITPKGEIYQYQYDSTGNLVQVIYPDNSFKQYHYENTGFPHALTGITDENADRYATFAYAADGKAILTQHAQTDNSVPQEKFALSYDSDTQTTVTDAIGTIEVLTFEENLGVKNLLSRINQTDNKGINRSYDDNNNRLSKTDAEGKITSYVYNASNQRIRKTEAVGSNAEKVTEYQYLSNGLNLPTQVQTSSVLTGNHKQTITNYNSDNTVQSIRLTGYQPDGTAISRSTSFQYNNLGQVIQIDGPQAGNQDITSLSYYNCNTGNQCGQLTQVSNALGQTTTYDQYDDNGRLIKSTAANGLITHYQYDSRGRVITLSQTPTQNQAQARTTDYSYDPAGQLLTVIQPNGLQLSYQYDAAHGLRSVTDNQGNQVNYFYDAKGNRTRTENKDASGTLLTAIEKVYDSRNRLQSINNAGNINQQIYDATGNLLTEIDPNQNPATEHAYDGLNRLQQTLDALGNTTDYQYDINNQLIQIKSPNNATTKYSYDDLGNLLQEHSPDRGIINYRHDNAGNVISTTDARGITANYYYDALNRVIDIDYPGTEEDIHYTYDNCLNGIGRLCRTEDPSGITHYAYDGYGNLTEQLKTTADKQYSTSYNYNAANQIIQTTYPNGHIVNYQRDVLGRITQVNTSTDGKIHLIAHNIQYRGDGLLTALTYGNGKQESRTYDAAGRLSCIQTDSLQQQCYQYDANGNIIEQQKIAQHHDYAYDVLDRLLQEDTSNNNWLYSYDENGNRLTRNLNQAVNDYVYQQDSNQLMTVDQQNIELDASGNTLTDNNGKRRFEYNQQGRLFKVYHKNKLKAVYTYNAQGQRSSKKIISESQNTNKGKNQTRPISNSKTIYYHYDQNGQLLAESHANNNKPEQDYIWLNNRPIAQLKTQLIGKQAKLQTAEVVYLHTDHLNTPRIGTDRDGVLIWRWESDAFGVTDVAVAESNLVKVNLRFPGQYFDGETGFYYNYYRYYDPTTGRYITSDPIGLQGGLNTYGYVYQNPLRYIDPDGQFAILLPLIPAITSTDIAIGGGLACLATGCGEAIGKLLSSIWDDLDGNVPESAADDIPGSNTLPDSESKKDRCIEKCYPLLAVPGLSSDIRTNNFNICLDDCLENPESCE